MFTKTYSDIYVAPYTTTELILPLDNSLMPNAVTFTTYINGIYKNNFDVKCCINIGNPDWSSATNTATIINKRPNYFYYLNILITSKIDTDVNVDLEVDTKTISIDTTNKLMWSYNE